MTAPTEPGKYPGDTYFADGGTQATHVWENGGWIKLGDQTRTHGDDSAVNDAPAGIDAIPADMPDAAHGDVPLEYNLQTFNALVAANTAMISELAGRDALVASADRRIDSLNEALAEAKRATADVEGHAEHYARLAKERKEALDEQKSELEFAIAGRDELQRKLDRVSGYLDRVFDEEDSIRAPDVRQVPAIKPAVGPNLDEIPRAVRRNARGDTDMPFAFRGDRIMHADEMPRRRKY